MKIFLTGATGYVGHKLALELAKKDFIIHALVRDTESNKIPKHKNIKLFKGDICDFSSIEKAIKSCTYVFHTAAYTNLKCNNVENYYNANVIGAENVLRAAQNNEVKKVVLTSTLAVFGPSFKQEPITENQPRLTSFFNDYELTKSMSEEVVRNYIKKGLNCTILNVSRVYGPGIVTYSNGVNRLIKKMIKSGVLLVPSKLNAVANYVFIDDVIHAHLLAMKSSKSDQFIIGGENIDYSSLFKMIKKLTNSRIKIIKIDYGLLRFCFSLFSVFGKLIGSNSSITPKVLDSLFVNRLSSSVKAFKELNYKSTSLQSGLFKTINFINH